jgi:tRNA1(Val) A37 N6-methylase TrmN6
MDETRDAIFGLGLTLTQPAAGHRVGADAVLLAAAAGPPAIKLVDVGAGVGAVGLALLKRWPEARADLIEVTPDLADFARKNAREAGLEERARILCLDVLVAKERRAAGLAPEKADLVITNPPFYAAGEVRVSPDVARARAHVFLSDAGENTLAAWVAASLALLKPGGRFVMIHRPENVALILDAIGKKLGAVAIRPIHPRAAEPAIRIVVSGVKGSRAPLKILPGLTLHEADGGFTPLAAAIHRGEARLDEAR